jgi:hypothetical protein
MMMRLMDRLFEYLSFNNISAYEFEHTCGLSNGYLGKQFRGKGTVGSNVLEKMKYHYPDLDIHWLLTGEENAAYVNEELIRSFNNQIRQLERMVADKDAIIELLQSSNY